MSMSEQECRMPSSDEIQCSCGANVCVEDLGDNPSYLSGECENCGKKWAGNHLAGYEEVE